MVFQPWPGVRAVEIRGRGTSGIVPSQFQGKTGVTPFAIDCALWGWGESRHMVFYGVCTAASELRFA